MTNPHLTLEGVSCILPDGRTLFSDLTEQFGCGFTALVGRNGAGKSVLARILAGELNPSAGGRAASGPVFYLPQRIVELSSLGLRAYGGNYTFYAECKALEQAGAQRDLEQRKLERKREEQRRREQRERQEHRGARENRQGRSANQAKILLGRQKERSEVSAGKLGARQAVARERLSQRVHEAALRVELETAIVMHAPGSARMQRRHAAQLLDAGLPDVVSEARRITLAVGGRQRIGVVGPNGSGKSTLLKMLAGQIQPLGGACQIHVPVAYLDQQLADLKRQCSVLDYMGAHIRNAGAALRTQLSQLGLGADEIARPSGELSGGERPKAALACALYADEPAQLLLLDEPGNHLDLASLRALESMLNQYQGALLVVSHDDFFLGQLNLSERLLASPRGWEWQAWR